VNISLSVTVGKKYMGIIINNYSACGKFVVSKSLAIKNDKNVIARYDARNFKTKEEIRQDNIKKLL
jgi:hypothetical protein